MGPGPASPAPPAPGPTAPLLPEANFQHLPTRPPNPACPRSNQTKPPVPPHTQRRAGPPLLPAPLPTAPLTFPSPMSRARSGAGCVTSQTPPRLPVPEEPRPGHDHAAPSSRCQTLRPGDRRLPPGCLSRLHATKGGITHGGTAAGRVPWQDTCPLGTSKQNQVLI